MDSVEREKLQHHLDDEVMRAIRQLREAMRDTLGADLPLRPPKN
jgi:hypothetical protein